MVNGEHKKPIDAKDLVIWEERCDQERGLIGQMVSDSLQVSIEVEDNPVEVWKTLASLFDKSDVLSTYYLEKKIHEIDPNNFDRIELYIAALKTLNKKLNNCGKDYKKIYIALIILVEHKLPSCFDMFIQTRNRSNEMSKGTTKPTFDEFFKGLINEKERLIDSNQLTPNKSLMAHNNKNPKKSFQPNTKGCCSHSSTNNSGNTSNVTLEVSKKKKVYDPCKYCGKTNNHEKSCYKGKRLNAKDKKQASNEQQVTLCSSFVQSSNSSSVEWIMDSGASKHMIGNASLFTSYDNNKNSSQKVSIGNGKQLGVVSSSNVKVTNSQLEDVFHVQNMPIMHVRKDINLYPIRINMFLKISTKILK